jgi:F-type H+-transporting ATPase subunit epsilon
LQAGNVRVKGDIKIDEAFKDKFSTGKNGETVLSITSGTIEMKDNKIIVLAD